jgi:hypothetical protein
MVRFYVAVGTDTYDSRSFPSSFGFRCGRDGRRYCAHFYFVGELYVNFLSL